MGWERSRVGSLSTSLIAQAVGSNGKTWPKLLTANPYRTLEVCPQFGPTLRVLVEQTCRPSRTNVMPAASWLFVKKPPDVSSFGLSSMEVMANMRKMKCMMKLAPARAGDRRFGRVSALRAHTKA